MSVLYELLRLGEMYTYHSLMKQRIRNLSLYANDYVEK